MKDFTFLFNNKNIVLPVAVILAVILFTALSRAMSGSTAESSTVKEWIKSGAFIVDVRTPEEFASGNYKGSINIPLTDIEKNINLFGDKNRRIIIYCRSGNRSGKAKSILEKHGYRNVLNGGGLKDMPK